MEAAPIKMNARCLRSVMATAFVLLVCLSLPAPVTAEMRMFELQHRPVGELAEVVRALVSDDAKVAAYGNTLVVNASPHELQEVAHLVSTYDRSQKMLRVTVEQGKSNKAGARDLTVSGRLHSDDGSVIIKPHWQDLSPGDISIRVKDGKNRLKVKASDTSYRESRSASQFITVMEGQSARISVGKAVPFTSQMLSYCRQHPAYIETISYEDVDTGFEVLPEMNNNMVDLSISPFMAFLDPRNPQQIIFHDLSTKVRIPAGGWYELGGHMQVQNGLSREILGGGVGGSERSSSIRVRVDPQ
jgi:type II secretory pathway component GspD/PulD (secretin)